MTSQTTGWIERVVIAVIGTVLAAAIIGLYQRQLEAERWRGMIQERIDYSLRTLERIERKLEP